MTPIVCGQGRRFFGTETPKAAAQAERKTLSRDDGKRKARVADEAAAMRTLRASP
jgi:hypothetical protein